MHQPDSCNSRFWGGFCSASGSGPRGDKRSDQVLLNVAALKGKGGPALTCDDVAGTALLEVLRHVLPKHCVDAKLAVHGQKEALGNVGIALGAAKNSSAPKVGTVHLNTRALVEVSAQYGKLAAPGTDTLRNRIGNFTTGRAEHNRVEELIFH